MLQMNVLIEAQGEPVLQLLTGLVEQKDAEHLVVDQATHELGDPSEQFVQVQNRSQFSGNFVEQQQDARPARVEQA